MEEEGELQRQVAELGIRSFALGCRTKTQYLSALFYLYDFFRREKFHVVQTHLFKASLVGLAAARLAKVPLTFFTGHHSHEVPLYNRKSLIFVDGLSGRFLANYTIAPSTDLKETLVRFQKVPESRIKIIHHGLDLESLREGSMQGRNLKRELGAEGKIVFGAVGRLFWVKAFDILIEAFSKISEVREDIVLWIVGEGRERGKLQRLVDEKRLGDRVLLLGRRDDVAAVMSEFDVFVHSSLAESFGLVIVEAFALGKPVISTRVGIAPEIIEDGINGLLVPAGQPQELRRAMCKMLQRQQDWQRMGDINRNLAENFTVQKTQALCDELYLELLGQV